MELVFINIVVIAMKEVTTYAKGCGKFVQLLQVISHHVAVSFHLTSVEAWWIDVYHVGLMFRVKVALSSV
jgi:hypothetical protein